MSPQDTVNFIRAQMPAGGLFAGLDWKTSPAPFALGEPLAKEIESLGRVLLQFYRAVNLLYRKSAEGKQPEWIARWLDLGKPSELIARQRSAAFKNDLPRVIRPDLLLTETGLAVTELDSVPGGIGLTAWLNRTYSALPGEPAPKPVLGGAEGMLTGFAGIFGDAKRVHLVVSAEAATYRPEMAWVAAQLGADRFSVRDTNFTDFQDGDAVYRFFELFDLANVPSSGKIFDLAAEKRIRLTPPPMPWSPSKAARGCVRIILWPVKATPRDRNSAAYWRRLCRRIKKSSTA